jgi:hypothetical protein
MIVDMKKFFTLFTAVFLFIIRTAAHEGMWIPAVLGAVYDDMKALGLELTPEQLYAVNESSLKDAIVLFGGGCTAEMVSDKGLMFTNHHCGYDYIQFHSSVANDYLTNGFWAMNAQQELVCKGLTATFVLRMDDVTAQMNEGILSSMSPEEVDKQRKANRAKVEAKAKAEGMDFSIKAFNYGNQYFVIYTKTYRDVRLVGAPPSGIGKFGGDSDNWVWPRHTGDFSVFRIYAGADNEPAEYSAANQPYAPKHFFPISLDGVQEGDYSMVYGFPGRTEHLLSSYSIDYLNNRSNPMRIDMRETSLGIIGQRMDVSDKLRIQYSAKQSNISNAYKKWVGQEMGLSRFRAFQIRQQEEKELMNQLAAENQKEAQAILPAIEKLYANYGDYLFARDAFVEYAYYGPELFAFAHDVTDVLLECDTLKKQGKWEQAVKELRANASLFYKDFDLTTEKMLFTAMSPKYTEYVKDGLGDQVFQPFLAKKGKGGVWQNAAQQIYDRSVFRDSVLFFQFLDGFSPKAMKKLSKDPVQRISQGIFNTFLSTLNPKNIEFTTQLNTWMYKYTALLAQRNDPRTAWLDANSTLRISFGKVEGSAPRDGMEYTYYTTSQGMLDKYYSGHSDYEMPQRLVDLLEAKEFGNYDFNGELRICYTGSNHTTGGNSGSPALNSKGHLVGINFDRSWESTMSDVFYSPEICRNIMVDARYVLWVIDVYAGADYLLEEMKLVKDSATGPKSK